MKKTSKNPVFAMIIIIAYFMPSYLAAEAWTKDRNKCRTFSKRFVAHTKIKNCGALFDHCRRRTKDCHFTDAECFRLRDNALYSEARASIGWRTEGVFPFEITWCCEPRTTLNLGPGDCGGYDNLFSPSIYSCSPILEPSYSDNKRLFLQASNVEFDYETHSVIISNIEGLLAMNSTDLINDFAALVISVTNEPEYVEYHNEEEDTRQYLSNLVWSAKAMFNNGEIQLNENFDVSHFIVDRESGNNSPSQAKLAIRELRIPISYEIDLDNLSVNFGVDGGNLGYGISEKFAIERVSHRILISDPAGISEDFNFLNYPNPISEELKISIALPYESSAQVILFDINGNVAAELFEGKLKKDQNLNLAFDVQNLKSNTTKHKVYFLKLITDRRTLIRKVLIE